MIFTPAMPGYILYPLYAVVVALLVYGFVKARTQGKRQIVRTVLRTVAVLLMCLAILRPSIPAVTEVEKLGTNMDIYFVLDTTASMGAEDITNGTEGNVSRLDAAKRQIADVAEANVGARYSLITLNAKAKIEIPLIRDLSALKGTLEVVTPQVYIEGLRNDGSSTLAAVETLQNSLVKESEAHPERVKVVYYITDGEDTAIKPVNPDGSRIADLSDERYVIGVGQEKPAEIPRYVFGEDFSDIVRDGYHKGPSVMDVEQLKIIADKLSAKLSIISSTSDTFPEVKSATVEEKLKLVDKRLPAQIEFYWILAILSVGLLILDAMNVTSQTYRLFTSRRGV